jgi:hypothetical protein
MLVSACDSEASTMRRPWPSRGYCDLKKFAILKLFEIFRNIEKNIYKLYIEDISLFQYKYRISSVV